MIRETKLNQSSAGTLRSSRKAAKKILQSLDGAQQNIEILYLMIHQLLILWNHIKS